VLSQLSVYDSLSIGRKPQVVSIFNSNPAVKQGWRLFARVFQQNSFMWQAFICGLSIAIYFFFYSPMVSLYKANNKHRTYEAAIAKEKAHKRKLKEQ
jgi:hypothetical protein